MLQHGFRPLVLITCFRNLNSAAKATEPVQATPERLFGGSSPNTWESDLRSGVCTESFIAHPSRHAFQPGLDIRECKPFYSGVARFNAHSSAHAAGPVSWWILNPPAVVLRYGRFRSWAPQQTGAPSSLRAQVWCVPLLMARNLMFSGVSASLSFHQHTANPSVVRAHV